MFVCVRQSRWRSRRSITSGDLSDRDECDHHLNLQAFGSNYTLCLTMRDFKDEPIVSRTWTELNVTVFGAKNKSEDVGISKLKLQYVTGHVLGEDFTSASGFLIDQHFYGTVYMRDTVHYLEVRELCCGPFQHKLAHC